MNFTKETLITAIDKLAQGGRAFSNERQFQFALAIELKDQGFNVDLEVLSSNEVKGEDNKVIAEKMYTDIIVEDTDKRIAIELKYKPPERRCEYKIDNKIVPTFPQGAPDIGAIQFWQDVVRLEKLFKKGEVQKGYAVLLTNDKTYWEGKVNSLFSEFFPVGEKGIKLYQYVKVDKITGKRVDGRTSMQKCNKEKVEQEDVSPVILNKTYNCAPKVNGSEDGWRPYPLDEKIAKEGNPDSPAFRYLILEIDLEK